MNPAARRTASGRVSPLGQRTGGQAVATVEAKEVEHNRHGRGARDRHQIGVRGEQDVALPGGHHTGVSSPDRAGSLDDAPARARERPRGASVEPEVGALREQALHDLADVAPTTGGSPAAARASMPMRGEAGGTAASLGFPAVLPRVVILRGHQANPWELRPWEELAGRYDVSYLRSERGLVRRLATAAAGSPGKDAAAAPASRSRGRRPGAVARRPLPRAERAARGRHRSFAGAGILVLGAGGTAAGARLQARAHRLGDDSVPDAYRNVRTRRYRRPS